jgi:hypothetical protein
MRRDSIYRSLQIAVAVFSVVTLRPGLAACTSHRLEAGATNLKNFPRQSLNLPLATPRSRLETLQFWPDLLEWCGCRGRA